MEVPWIKTKTPQNIGFRMWEGFKSLSHSAESMLLIPLRSFATKLRTKAKWLETFDFPNFHKVLSRSLKKKTKL